MKADVCIVGSGPVGAVFATLLERAGRTVVMVESGAQCSPRYGENLQNAVSYQQNKRLFAHTVFSQIDPFSVAAVPPALGGIDPAAGTGRFAVGRINGANPEQDPRRNLTNAGITRRVGGMATHWTSITPRQHPTMERTSLISGDEWDSLYGEAEALMRTTTDLFDDSMTHRLVLDTLRAEYKELGHPYQAQSIPRAGRRRPGNPALVEWTGADTILGRLAEPGASERFTLLTQHLCTRLATDTTSGRIEYAQATNLLSGQSVRIEAETFIVAGGAIATPQLLWASGIRPDPLGRYLTDHPVAFGQVLLLGNLIDSLTDGTAASGEVPIPDSYLEEPNVYIPVSASRPWQGQIYRDVFQEAYPISNVDRRFVADLRWFGSVGPRPDNRVTFSDAHRDNHGLPQATFDFTLSPADRERCHAMMADLLRAASALGGFLPGAEPKFMPPGLSQHMTGTTRMGDTPDTSVVDTHSQVWGINNLYLGGNNVIPTENVCNPTLTSLAIAIKAAHKISNK